MPLVDIERDAVDGCGGGAVEHDHRLADVLWGQRRAAGVVAIILGEGQPQIGVRPGQRSVGRTGADRVDPYALLLQEVVALPRDITVDRLLAESVVDDARGLALLAPV